VQSTMLLGAMNDVAGRLKRLDEFTLSDLDSMALMLHGGSVIDWHRLHFTTTEEARELIMAQELSPDDPKDRARIEHLKREAISYLRRHFEFPIPRPIEQASPEELLLVASTKGHRQVCACSVLKAMHIIHHLDGRELLFTLPLSDQEIFHLVEEKVYRVIGGMLAAGFPITEFVGGRKTRTRSTPSSSPNRTRSPPPFTTSCAFASSPDRRTTSCRCSCTCRSGSSRSTTSSRARA